MSLIAVRLFILVFAFSHSAWTYEQNVKKSNSQDMPKELQGIGIDQNLGEQIDLSLEFINEEGKTIRLADIWNGERPVILSLVYYTCPSLCNFHLNGLIEGLKEMNWNPGQEYDLVAVTIDPKEEYFTAAAKKDNYLEMFGREGIRDGVHFLTGSQESITKLASKVGFKYKWIEKEKEWAHASAAIITSPQGKLSRYLNGVVFNPRDLRLALNEAGQGRIGNVIDTLILFCFRFDPEKNKYSLYAFNVMRAGGGLTILFLLFLMIPVYLKSRRSKLK